MDNAHTVAMRSAARAHWAAANMACQYPSSSDGPDEAYIALYLAYAAQKEDAAQLRQELESALTELKSLKGQLKVALKKARGNETRALNEERGTCWEAKVTELEAQVTRERAKVARLEVRLQMAEQGFLGPAPLPPPGAPSAASQASGSPLLLEPPMLPPGVDAFGQ